MKLDLIKYLIFDLDGTLIDSSAGVIEATNYALEKMGQSKRSPDEIKKFIGFPLDIMFPAFCSAPVKQLKEAFQEKGRGLIVDKSVALDGVDAFLPKLAAAGYRMAVATTKFKHHTRGALEKFGWDKYFIATASGDEVANVKPAPDLIELALQRLGADPSKSVMIGDTVNDIKAARQAGLAVIAVRSPFGADDLASYNPDFLIDKLTDLAELLNM